jgi:hypothetical protein
VHQAGQRMGPGLMSYQAVSSTVVRGDVGDYFRSFGGL